ncbi:ParA family protein [Acinetobacter bereziniae]|uniref:ParA family protein n=1 Tax=Acinetobacter bereziniae TaxID=106648 RepID=UPI0020762067|nr:ParA family protein [Acinetobacter bereziniae]MCM8510873.1 ParA family protein [Acinetobacter bereziniae]
MNKKYLLWNNKGGVGKTFLSYMLSVEYAINHPDEDVVVIDACPQTNVSEIILGGNGSGAEVVNEFSRNNQTIAGYIKERFNTKQGSKLGTESTYFKRAVDYNEKMPSNLYILPGDMDLDICSKIINHLAISPVKEAWKISRSLINDLVTSFESAHATNGRKQVFFIDCNPSFSNYTENAIVASNRIIIPCTADAASIRGIKNLFKLIYNISLDDQELSDQFEDFHHDCNRNGVTLPKIHLLVQNRSRTNTRDAAQAFQSHADEITRLVNDDIMSQYSNILTDDAIADRVLNIKDGNTLASIINHEGCPLSSLMHKRYTIYGQKTQANQKQIDALRADIDHIVTFI